MRVLHTIASLDPSAGGPARSVPQLAAAQTALGHCVMLWSADPSPPPLADPEDGTRACRRLSGRLTEALEAAGPIDLIHDHGLWLPVNHQVAREAARRGVPRVVSPRGMLEPWSLQHKALKKRLAWWLYQRRDLRSAAALHATSRSEADQLRQLGLPNPIILAPNGVPLPVLPEEDGPVAANPPKPGPRTALFISRIHKVKGLPMLVQAWAQLRPAGWRMQVVGPDEDGHRAELETMVRTAGLADSWSFHGPAEGPAKWQALQEADLLILPTHSESFGIVVAEALASGRPVITTQGAPWEGLISHGCGWWTDISPAGLLGALREACALDRTSLRSMGRRGRLWMQQDFAWPAIARTIIEGYKQALAHRC